ncbi:MAG TPA: TIGR03435 family protein [Vicinamibacterales bacterium]|nr:TIGR03435 family protein [Vicinamibacterales bacterium]
MNISTAAALAVCVTATGISFTPIVGAQGPAAGAPKVDVATIHRNKEIESIRAAAPPGQGFGPVRLRVLPGGRLDATGISTMELIREAYGYSNRPAPDVTGPAWLDVERFDVAIKADREDMGPGQPAGLLPLGAAQMMREFLADRFKLRVRIEKKERNIYELRVARDDRKLGPGLVPSDGSCVGIYAPPGPQPRCPFVLGGGRGFQAGHLTMAELGTFFGAFPAINTTVVDKTELPGAFDVTMSAFVGGGVANANADDPRPSMFTAVQQMLGLKLERVRGTADVIVVERVERPTEN